MDEINEDVATATNEDAVANEDVTSSLMKTQLRC